MERAFVTMGLASKRKGRWRYRCWHKMFFMLIGFPLGAGGVLGIIAIFRALFILHQTEPNLVELQNQEVDIINDGQMFKRAQRLAGALQIPTISYATDNQEKEALLQMHHYLEKTFPLIHSCPYIKKEVINEYSLLYTVYGSNNGNRLPYLLASHLDVVPVEQKAWQVPPFSGQIVNNSYIYGRGAIDDKAGVMGILEALEYMIEKGQRSWRTFYIAFGHDEEISGKRGAQELAKTLTKRGVVRLDFVLDEGFPLTKDLFPGTDRPIALVGVSEKGSATIELSVTGTPGHSSFPPVESVIGILAAAVARLEESPQPALLGNGPESATFQYLAPHVSFGYRLLYNNLWLFSGLMARAMENTPITNAIVRTTTAITVFHAGIKDNVVPSSAMAVINHRVHPAQTVAEVLAHDREVIADHRVHIKVRRSREAHPVSPFGPDSIAFQMVSSSIRQVYQDAIIVPGVFIANTDTRWYLGLTNNLYRFLPTVVLPSDVRRYHGCTHLISPTSEARPLLSFFFIIKITLIVMRWNMRDTNLVLRKFHI